MKKIKAGVFLSLILIPLALSFAKTKLGVDVLEEEDYAVLERANVGLITNHTGLTREGMSTVDLFQTVPTLRLRCIMSPDHGFRGEGEHGQKIEDAMDPKTGVPLYSLYGQTTRPTEEMLKGIDTLVYDIQDIGTRFYTYITTMAQAMEEAARKNIRFVVLDRPNPIRGDIIEGDILDSDIKRMTGYFQIPVRYGLTVGELAQWFNKTQNLGAKLTVVKMKNWKRNQWFDETRLPFISPSPNIPHLASAHLYVGIGCFEATNVSVGRGTETPFQIFGAPWIKGDALCAALRQLNFQGFLFEPVVFTPAKDIYAGERCEGVRILVTDRNQARPFSLFISAFLFLYENYSSDFKPDWDEVRVVTGSNRLRQAAENKIPLKDLLTQYEEASRAFQKEISAFYLY